MYVIGCNNLLIRLFRRENMHFYEFIGVLRQRIVREAGSQIKMIHGTQLFGCICRPQMLKAGSAITGFFTQFSVSGNRMICLFVDVSARQHPYVCAIERPVFPEHQKLLLFGDGEEMYGIRIVPAGFFCCTSIG